MNPFILTLAAGDSPSPVPHAVNHPFIVTESGMWLWSAHQGSLVLAGLIMLILGPMIAKSVATGPESEGPGRYVTRGKFAHMIEAICVFLRENTVRPLLGKRTDGFMPFLGVLFFFILTCNLIGLLPLIEIQHMLFPSWKASHKAIVGGTATQNIFVTGVLAFASFLVINAAGVKALGPKGYMQHLTAGAPVFVAPLIVVLEIMGIFIKPIALAIRLFANMTAGHILLATLFMFVGMAFAHGNGLLAGGVTIVSAIAATAIFFLELFVAFLQAFVFMFLTTVFISLLDHHHDEEHHAEEHLHGETPVTTL